MKGTRDLAPYALPLCAAVVFVLSCLAQVMGARSASIWRGYHTLLVKEGIPLEEIVARLEERLPASRIVSALTATVSITTFSGREEIPVAEIDARLDPLDPRLDGYTRKLGGMFRGSIDGSAANVIYLRSALPALLVSPLLRRPLDGLEGQWTLAGPAAGSRIPACVAALLYLGLVAWGRRSTRGLAFTAASALPWLIGCSAGGLGELLGFFLVFPFCLSLLLELRSSWPSGRVPRLAEIATARVTSGLIALGAALGLDAAIISAQGGGGMEVLRPTAAVLSDALLLVAVLLWRRSRAAQAAHAVFAPVPIGGSIYRYVRKSIGRRERGLRSALDSMRTVFSGWGTELVILVLLVCLSPLLSLVEGRRAPGVYPAPAKGGSPLGWGSLERLWVLSGSDELPSVAEYVAHEAYQLSLAYGWSYRLPARREAVTVRSFTRAPDGPALVAGRRTVARFDDRWLRRTLSRARPGTVDALLASQRRAVRVSPESLPEPSGGSAVWKAVLGFAMAALFLIAGSRFLGPSALLGGARRPLERRRPEEA